MKQDDGLQHIMLSKRNQAQKDTNAQFHIYAVLVQAKLIQNDKNQKSGCLVGGWVGDWEMAQGNALERWKCFIT